jgi:hypothetical protein
LNKPQAWLDGFTWGEHLIERSPLSGIVEGIMSHHAARRRKPELSPHQKQIRFLTRLAVILCSLLTLGIFWFANRSVPMTH